MKNCYSKEKFVYLLTFLFLLCSMVPCGAADLKEGSELYVPILFSTDRVIDPDPRKLDYLTEQLAPGQLNYANKTVLVSIPKGCHLSASEAARLGWSIKDSDSQPSIENLTLTRDEFLARAASLQKSNVQGNLLFFVHGCCTKHSEAIVAAAQAAVMYGCPIVMYDWCSPHWNYLDLLSDGDYLKNETFVEDSTDRFCKLFLALEGVLAFDKVDVLAHSMGNRLIDRLAVKRYDLFGSNSAHTKLAEIALANADEPVDAVAGHLSTIAWNANIVRIYTNDSDIALSASKRIHKQNRLGAPHLDLKLFTETDGVDVIDHHPSSGASHALPLWLTSDMSKLGKIDPRRGWVLNQLSPHFSRVTRSQAE